MNEPWCKQDKDGLVLSLHVQPGAKRSEVVGMHRDALKIRVAAQAVEGQANAALLRWLADRLDCRIADLELLSGATGRQKRIRLRTECAAAEVERRLKP
ncbi:MAG: DUF167 domain-containing protein [Candidatus Protistobacter heckmanni]|nr:DUF167 domain-containing protein [Candidatus Protistobacter heckmanni]